MWTLGSSKHPNATVVEIDAVDMPGVEKGGNRGRLLTFAARALSEAPSIRCFADADSDRLLGRQVPKNVWLTDLRALESYVLRADCIEKILRLGVGTDKGDASVILKSVLAASRELAALRLASEYHSLELPFQSVRLERHVSVDGLTMVVDVRGVLRAVLQNANMPLTRCDEISAMAADMAARMEEFDDLQVAHGKDAVALLSALLVRHGVARDDAPRLFWTSFERAMADEYVVLQEVLAFLHTCGFHR
jgi:hypothetical protein